MRKRRKQISIELNNEIEKTPVPIVSDAAVASVGIGDGRLLPVLIIDSSSRPDIEDMVKAHKHLGSGDADTIWLKRSKQKDEKIGLAIIITKPSRCVILLEFDILNQGSLVDLIVHSRGLYLQCGRKGDRLFSTIAEDRILVEVPSINFQQEWNKLLHDTLTRDFRKQGYKKHEAKKLSEEVVQAWRDFGGFRMKRP